MFTKSQNSWGEGACEHQGGCSHEYTGQWARKHSTQLRARGLTQTAGGVAHSFIQTTTHAGSRHHAVGPQGVQELGRTAFKSVVQTLGGTGAMPGNAPSAS